jgi:hypothetical protein
MESHAYLQFSLENHDPSLLQLAGGVGYETLGMGYWTSTQNIKEITPQTTAHSP